MEMKKGRTYLMIRCETERKTEREKSVDEDDNLDGH